MIFSKRSNYMLKYEKSKSKLIEFNIAEDNYPKYPLNPDDLTYTTIFALSRFCEEIIDYPTSPKLPKLKEELTIVSQYYDSTVKTQLRKEYSKLFLLLGSTAYFLSEDFGSAKVLIEQINEWIPNDSVMTLLYSTLRFLLNGEWTEVPTKRKYYRRYLDGLKSHFESGNSPDPIYDSLKKMRSKIYRSTNVIDVNYIDFLYSVIICSINHSAWIMLPEYSNADFEQWRDYLLKPNSVKLLWPAQKVILEAGVLVDNDLVVPLPTGVGKTKSIEIILRAKFMNKGTCVAVVIAPLRALCNEITADLSSALGDEAVINQFTDTVQEDFDLEILLNTKYVFICTPEKFSYILRHEPDFLKSIQLFIFDEAHLFDDTSRGAQYELLVSEIAKSRNEYAQMVLFSAVLSNANQISGWLFYDENATIDYSLVKSTEKSIGFLSTFDQTIHYYEKDNMAEESFYVPKSIDFKQLRLRRKETKKRIFPEKNAQDIAIYYANKLCTQGSAAIYAGQVRSIPTIMRRIVEINERGYDLSNLLVNGNPNEVDKLFELFKLHYGENHELTQTAKLGAFPHYSNLPNGIKMAIEHALRRKHISFVVCTTTLAEGVNIPIKYLFLTTFALGNTSIQIRKMQNLVGRTARAGIHTEGSAIITDSKFYDNRLKWQGGGKYRWAGCKSMFNYDNAEACGSAILSLVSDLPIDYDICYESSDLMSYLVENYGAPQCFEGLANAINEDYKKRISDDARYERYRSEIWPKVAQLEHVIENVENYLCYIYNYQQSPENFFDSVEELVSQTFAYYLGDEEQKKSLSVIFSLIAKKIMSDVKPEKSVYYAKSLYGIDISKQVLSWVDSNIENLIVCSTDQLLIAVANLFKQLFPDRTTLDIDELIDILRLWIKGMPYVAIYNSLQQKFQISQIEKICSSIFSYHLCFLIGNVVDAIGEQSEKLTEHLVLLQKMIKYGVPSHFQICVCENIFDERIIARKLERLVSQKPITDKEFKKYITSKRDEILPILKSYPEYFSYKFRLYVK